MPYSVRDIRRKVLLCRNQQLTRSHVIGFAFLAGLVATAALLLSGSFAPIGAQTASDRMDWPSYGNDPGAMRYVNFDQINPNNVATLQPAWIFHTKVMNNNTSFESQPLIVDGVLYVTSPHGHVFALDAASGALKWTFNP